jgi:hypothetical protein
MSASCPTCHHLHSTGRRCGSNRRRIRTLGPKVWGEGGAAPFTHIAHEQAPTSEPVTFCLSSVPGLGCTGSQPTICRIWSNTKTPKPLLYRIHRDISYDSPRDVRDNARAQIWANTSRIGTGIANNAPSAVPFVRPAPLNFVGVNLWVEVRRFADILRSARRFRALDAIHGTRNCCLATTAETFHALHPAK